MAPIETPSNGIPRYVFTRVGNSTYGYQMTVTESIKWSIYQWMVMLAVFGLIYGIAMLFVPLLFIAAYFYCVKEERWLVNVIGILASLLVVMDYHNGWIMHKVYIYLFNAPDFFAIVCGVNLGLIIAHITLLLIGNSLMATNTSVRYVPAVKLTFIICVVIGIFAMITVKPITPYLKSDKYKEDIKKEQESPYNKQLEEEKKEFHERMKKYRSDGDGF